MSRREPLPDLTEAEWKVMQALWKRHPASARDVLETLGEETTWAYSTVKTLLARLVEKDAVSARMRANTSLYEPLLSEGDAKSTEVRALLDRAFGGAFAPMLRFVLTEEKLSAGERAELREMLARTDAERAERKR